MWTFSDTLREQWTQHEKDWMTYLYYLALHESPDVIVEIGTGPGASTSAFSIALRDNGKGMLYSIDPSPHVEEVFKRLHNRGLGEYVIRVKEYSEFGEKHTPKDLKISILLIDGDHYYKPVIVDWKVWGKYLVKNAIVIFHDLHLPEVKQAYDDICRPFPESCYWEWNKNENLNYVGMLRI